ncbi:MAG: Gfo/Idh/MocA family oxidoreductase [Acidimicrobiia bacterium]|nr:Gfo/Idh/MocA family oxidoreductase [Acidimicrobiia bacterium]
MRKARARTNGRAVVYTDYRKLLDSRDVDAVVIATPDHWHAKIFVDACVAGKDIYVEKPIANSVREGRVMVEAARKSGRVVQVGLPQRSGGAD